MLRTQGVFLLCESEVEASQCNAQVLGGRITIHEGQTKAGSIEYWENEKGWQTTVRKKKKGGRQCTGSTRGKKKKEGGEKKAWKRGENVEQHKSGARGEKCLEERREAGPGRQKSTCCLFNIRKGRQMQLGSPHPCAARERPPAVSRSSWGASGARSGAGGLSAGCTRGWVRIRPRQNPAGRRLPPPPASAPSQSRSLLSKGKASAGTGAEDARWKKLTV